VNKVSNLVRLCYSVIRKHPYYWAAGIILPVVAAQFVTIALNDSVSLPQTIFIVVKGSQVEKSGYVAFRWNGAGPYRKGITFIKIVAGVPGDTVTAQGHEYFVNGQYVGTAKERSRTGEPLQPGSTGVITDGSYYVMTPHVDSLDSRYAMTGWIQKQAIIGRAYAVF